MLYQLVSFMSFMCCAHRIGQHSSLHLKAHSGDTLNHHETDSWIALVSFTSRTTSACLASTGLSNTPACWHIVPPPFSGSCVSWVKLSLSCSLTCICTWSKTHSMCLWLKCPLSRLEISVVEFFSSCSFMWILWICLHHWPEHVYPDS